MLCMKSALLSLMQKKSSQIKHEKHLAFEKGMDETKMFNSNIEVPWSHDDEKKMYTAYYVCWAFHWDAKCSTASM